MKRYLLLLVLLGLSSAVSLLAKDPPSERTTGVIDPKGRESTYRVNGFLQYLRFEKSDANQYPALVESSRPVVLQPHSDDETASTGTIKLVGRGSYGWNLLHVNYLPGLVTSSVPVQLTGSYLGSMDSGGHPVFGVQDVRIRGYRILPPMVEDLVKSGGDLRKSRSVKMALFECLASTGRDGAHLVGQTLEPGLVARFKFRGTDGVPAQDVQYDLLASRILK